VTTPKAPLDVGVGDSPRVRVANALVDAHRKIESHGGALDWEYDESARRVIVRLGGTCRGCAALTVTYVAALRVPLLALPEVDEVQFDGPPISRFAVARIEKLYWPSGTPTTTDRR
jgi:Fe-S cluster biogenesis protein NfuA